MTRALKHRIQARTFSKGGREGGKKKLTEVKRKERREGRERGVDRRGN